MAEVVLLGSTARGDDTPDPDIDLQVLTTRPITREERRAMTQETLPI